MSPHSQTAPGAAGDALVAFHAWWYDYCIKASLGDTPQRQELARVAWMAAYRQYGPAERDAVLEEAAKACETTPVYADMMMHARQATRSDCAFNVRALKRSSATECGVKK